MSLHNTDPCSNSCFLITKIQQEQKTAWVVYSAKTENLYGARCSIKPLCRESNCC